MAVVAVCPMWAWGLGFEGTAGCHRQVSSQKSDTLTRAILGAAALLNRAALGPRALASCVFSAWPSLAI